MPISARSIRKRAFLAPLALLALCAASGCVGAPTDTQALNGGNRVVQSSTSGLVQATVSLGAAVLQRGQNDFLIELRSGDGADANAEPDAGADADAEPGSDAGPGIDAGSAVDTPVLVSAVATMPAHGHSVTATSIVPEGSAYRVRGLDLFMSGLWQVDLGVVLGARSDHVEFTLDVP
ncbi:MAG TPA: hypothetical protein VNW92_21995 [Polyangiaceae bacterium]|jgi:hypothetical protein|nr:hypothetical protein [Polyangiaceae bacterium]